ncbi:siphovirus Gp157 family protein [Hyphomonas sp.]|jgi:hypothetical protein|uniref:siphovirus Gp157 family protein n=1 Tax=Hyphomonas sp. TaxID=87 RepID=UPI00118BA4D7|nr:siphovirus Gp157 family protein [Hyphomonas sp.]QDP49118.1 MAG: hypothetical protein Unbinned4811contig1001_63 [Prokaryotic dsDNA virus sp.]|tara:strand:- start:291 stop:815 length:525 start_codon:yes stop_codon:yes gene_type:complete
MNDKGGVEKTISKARQELSRWDELRRQLEGIDADPEELFDTLDGETELTDALLLIAEEIAEREAMSTAVGGRIKDLQERKSRIDNSTDTLRQIILVTMSRAEIGKIKGDLCTLSIGNTKPKAEIVDEALIPAKFWKPQDPKLDKAALSKAMNDGEVIPGVQKSNGGINMIIRRK